MSNIKAEIVADSLAPTGERLTSVLLTYPRIIHAELLTHRTFCLAGDSILEFDLPSGSTKSKFRVHRMTIEDFVRKWHKGAKLRPRHSTKVNFPNECYTAKQLSKLTGKGVSNIRTVCRDGILKVQNPNKKRSDDWIINGLDYNDYHNGYESKGHNIKDRLKSMKIRILNEESNRIENSTVKNCTISGEKEVFEIVLHDGKTIKSSKDHRFLTDEGWKPLKEIQIGENIIVQSFGTEENEKTDNKRFKFIDGKWVQKWLRDIKYDVIRNQNNKCKNCDNEIEDLHHIIPIYKDKSLAFEFNNIEGLCKDCHNEKHKKQDWQISQYLYGKSTPVISIKSVGIEQTYDLEIEGDFPNFIANGIVVHNSRNAASSRAVPVKKMIESVKNNTYIPMEFQKAHSGMQGSEYFEGKDKEKCISLWLEAAYFNLQQAEEMNKHGISKQIINRILEPYQYYTSLVTSTEWENFFSLRCPSYTIDNQFYFKSRKKLKEFYNEEFNKIDILKDKNFFVEDTNNLTWLRSNKGQAEIHLMQLAECIYDVMNESTPKELQSGDWHIPFEDKINTEKCKDIIIKNLKERGEIYGTLEENRWEEYINFKKVQISTALSARTSYTVVGEEKEIDYDKMIKLHNKLIQLNHRSPLEHIGRVMTDYEYDHFTKGNIDTKNDENYKLIKGWDRNFKGFRQYRSIIEENVLN